MLVVEVVYFHFPLINLYLFFIYKVERDITVFKIRFRLVLTINKNLKGGELTNTTRLQVDTKLSIYT